MGRLTVVFQLHRSKQPVLSISLLCSEFCSFLVQLLTATQHGTRIKLRHGLSLSSSAVTPLDDNPLEYYVIFRYFRWSENCHKSSPQWFFVVGRRKIWFKSSPKGCSWSELNQTQSSVKFSELFLGLRFTSPKNWITHLFGIKAPRKRIYDGAEYHSDSFVHVRWVGRIIIFFGWWGNNRILQQVTITNKQLNKFIPYNPERTLTNHLPIPAKTNAQKRCQCLNANIAKLY